MASNRKRGNTLDSYLNPNGYVSCIRIGGLPILPPLITDERQKEIQDDRNKAIMIEKRLKNKRNSADSGVMTGSYTDDKLSFWQSQQLFLSTVGNQCNEYNNSITDLIEELSTSFKVEDIDENYVKHAIEDDEFKSFICSNIVKALKENSESVTPESVSSGMSCSENFDSIGADHSDIQVTNELFIEDKLFSVPLNSEKSKEEREEIFTKWTEFDSNDALDVTICKSLSLISPRLGTDICCNEIENKLPLLNSDVNIKVEETNIPVLVRRKSYVLESPSPALLEHLKNQDTRTSFPDLNCNVQSIGSMNIINNANPVKKQRKLWNHVEKKAFLQRCKNLNIPQLKSNNLFIQGYSGSLPSLSVSDLMYNIQRTFSADSIFNSTKEQSSGACGSILQKVNVNSKIQSNRIKTNADFLNPTYNNNRRYSEKIIHAHSVHSPEIINHNDNYKRDLGYMVGTKILQSTISDKKSTGTSSHRENYVPYANRSEDCYSECSSISLSRFLPSSHEEPFSSPSAVEDLSQFLSHLKIQHEQQLEELLKKQQEETKVLLSNRFQSPVVSNNSFEQKPDAKFNNYVQNSSKRRSSCSRELFPEKSLEKEHKAASKICAYVRGYLTRRLLHTERVQQIIETIRESLLCALNLRLESALKPIDLDLNTRLIKQLTSACYELHDVFSLPVVQRMAVIAADREKKRKKTPRPTSATVSEATKRALFRKQQNGNLKSTIKLPNQTPRARARSCSSASSCSVTKTGHPTPVSLKRCSSSHNTRQPWR